jgi:hypothetical protein
MPRWLDDGNFVGCDMSVRSLQCVWRDGVQQLQRRLRVRCRLNQRDDRCVPCWSLQRGWRDVVQQLQRRLRVSSCVDIGNSGIVDVCGRSILAVWRDGVQHL